MRQIRRKTMATSRPTGTELPVQLIDGVPAADLLTLTEADRLEAQRQSDEIIGEGGSIARWDSPDRTAALSAAVHNLVNPNPTCQETAEHCLEQFYRYGDVGQPRGGQVWRRPTPVAARR